LGGEGSGLYFGGESSATVTLAGQRLALCEDAELVRLNVLQILSALGVGLGYGGHKLQFVLVFDAPASKLSLHFICYALLLRKFGKGHANGSNHMAQLEGLVEGE